MRLEPGSADHLGPVSMCEPSYARTESMRPRSISGTASRSAVWPSQRSAWTYTGLRRGVRALAPERHDRGEDDLARIVGVAQAAPHGVGAVAGDRRDRARAPAGLVGDAFGQCVDGEARH